MYHLDRAIGPNGPSIFEVITLGSVPPMFRKMTTDIVRGDVLRDQWGRTVFLYQDEQLWKQRLAVKPGRYSYVVILDGAGTVRWIGSGPYSEAKMAELKAALGAVHTAAE
jgi:hypothetical protein